MNLHKKILTLLAVVGLLAAACGSSQDDSSLSDDSAPLQQTSALKIGRANWPSSHFLSEVHVALLRELGYEVVDPSTYDLSPEIGFVAIAERDIDAWPSGWFPLHNRWLKSELTDGTLVESRVEILGEQIIAGGLQGYVIDKSFGEQYNILTLDDLNENPAAIAAFDAVDPFPGNGVADMYGCPNNWTCDNVIDQQIAFSGWENIRQYNGQGGTSYDFLVAAALGHLQDSEPFVMYLYGPTAYLVQLRPGDNVYWLGVDDIVDDSNPAGMPDGETFDQRPGTQPISASECPVVATREDGLCPAGFAAVDILVAANREFVAEYPAAAALMAAVKISAIDVSLALIEVANGGDPADAAKEWVEENRNLVDGWLEIARAAA